MPLIADMEPNVPDRPIADIGTAFEWIKSFLANVFLIKAITDGGLTLRNRPIYLLPLLALCAPLQAQESETIPRPAQQGRGAAVEIFTGVEFQQQEVADTEQVHKFSAPLTARLTTGPLRISVQLPYVRVTGPGNVVAPSGPLGLPILIDPSKPAEVSTRAGLGDLRVAASYSLHVSGLSVLLNSGAKLPTASAEKGLGTGKADYWVGTDVSTTVGAVTPFAGVAYTMAGDPEGFELRNTFSGQAGAALRLGRSTSAHLGYSYAEDAGQSAQDEQRVFGGVNTAVGNGLSLGFYGSAGVNGPANVGAGLSLGIGLR